MIWETGMKRKVKGATDYKIMAFLIIIIVVVAVIIATVFLLTSCKKTNISEQRPPELRIGIENADDIIRASTYGYYWSWKEKGKKQQIVADGISPLEDSDITTMYLDDSTHTLKFDFAQEPDCVNVVCINVENNKDVNDYGNKALNVTYDSVTNTIEIPQVYSLVCVINAEWYGIGKAKYSFRILRNKYTENKEKDIKE